MTPEIAAAIDDKGLCGFPTLTCTDWERARKWWSHDGIVYRTKPAKGLVEVPAVFSANRDGLDANPADSGSLLMTFYASDPSGVSKHRTFESFFASGGIAVQHREGPAGSMKKARRDNDSKDDGFRQREIEINGRKRLLMETTDPPTGVNGYTLWWALPLAGGSEREVVVEVLTDSKAVTEDELIAFVQALDGP